VSHQDVVDIQEDQDDGVGRMQVVQAAIMFTLFEAEGDESGVNLIIPELATTLGTVEAFEKTVDVLLAVHLLGLSLRWANVDLVLAVTLEVGVLHIEVSNLEIELGGESTKALRVSKQQVGCRDRQGHRAACHL